MLLVSSGSASCCGGDGGADVGRSADARVDGAAEGKRRGRGRGGRSETGLTDNESCFFEIELFGEEAQRLEIKVDRTVVTSGEGVFVGDEVEGNDLVGRIAVSDGEALISDKAELIVVVACVGIVVEEELFMGSGGKGLGVAVHAKQCELSILVGSGKEPAIWGEASVGDLRRNAVDGIV